MSRYLREQTHTQDILLSVTSSRFDSLVCVFKFISLLTVLDLQCVGVTDS